MNFVYILRSLKDSGYYIGITEDIDYRLEDHNHGRVKSTSARRPLGLFYYEAYSKKEYAEKREKKLKQFGSAYTGLLKRLGCK